MMPATIQFSSLIPDEDGSEFERELAGALEGLSVTSTAEKLSKVAGHIYCKHQAIYFKADVSLWQRFQQACKSTCSQITDMTQPQEEDGEEAAKRASVEVLIQI